MADLPPTLLMSQGARFFQEIAEDETRRQARQRRLCSQHCTSFSSDLPIHICMTLHRLCLQITRGCKAFGQIVRQTNPCAREVHKNTEQIKSKASSRWLRMIQEADDNEGGAKMQASSKTPTAGLKHKRSRDSEGEDELPKRTRLATEEVEVVEKKDNALIVCFDLELADGSFASEIFQVSFLITLSRLHVIFHL